MKQIIIDFPDIFISVNQQYGSVRFGKTTMPRIRLTMRAKVYKEAVGWECKRAYKGKPLEGPVKVSIWYWFTSKRQDLGNDKITMDAMENIIYKNDRQIHEMHLYKNYAKKPRTKIIVEEL